MAWPPVLSHRVERAMCRDRNHRVQASREARASRLERLGVRSWAISRREEDEVQVQSPKRSVKVGDTEPELRCPKKSQEGEAQSQWHLVLPGKTSKFWPATWPPRGGPLPLSHGEKRAVQSLSPLLSINLHLQTERKISNR